MPKPVPTPFYEQIDFWFHVFTITGGISTLVSIIFGFYKLYQCCRDRRLARRLASQLDNVESRQETSQENVALLNKSGPSGVENEGYQSMELGSSAVSMRMSTLLEKEADQDDLEHMANIESEDSALQSGLDRKVIKALTDPYYKN